MSGVTSINLNSTAAQSPAERSQDFFSDGVPGILFVAEYVVDNMVLGCLVAWRRVDFATHYEVFKRDSFARANNLNGFSRLLLLKNRDLARETNKFSRYIRETLGFSSFSSEEHFVILDTVTKIDRIYEYKIRAVKIPDAVIDLDFFSAYYSRGLLDRRQIPETFNTLEDVAVNFYGSKKYAWLLAFVNPGATYITSSDLSLNKIFQSISLTQSGANGSTRTLFMPSNFSFTEKLIQDAVSVFEIDNVFVKIFESLGVPISETNSLRDAYIQAIDKPVAGFSVRQFRNNFNNFVEPVDWALFDLSLQEDIGGGPLFTSDFATLKDLFAFQDVTDTIFYAQKAYQFALSDSPTSSSVVEPTTSISTTVDQAQNARDEQVPVVGTSDAGTRTQVK